MATALPEPRQGIVAQGARTILIVEDDVEILESLRDRLAQEGFAVRTALDGQQALDDLLSHERPSLILLDLRLPVRSGWELLEALRRSDTLITIPVVVVSAYLSFPPIGAVAWVRKPFKPDQLIAVIKEHCLS
jgi:DNA-binding response OmpR family regulator